MKIRFWFLLGIVALALYACGGSNIATSSNSAQTSVPTINPAVNATGTAAMATMEATTTAPPLHFSVGDTVDIGGTWEIRILSVKKSMGDDVIAPQAGNTFISFDVTMKNISTSEQESFGGAMFTLRDSTGQAIITTYAPNTPQAPSGKVEAGTQIRGTISYEVPLTEHQFTLAFENDALSTGQAIWDIKI